MEDYDVQMWCKVEASTNKTLVAEECSPEQLGIGIAAGVETMIHGMQMEMEIARNNRETKVLAKFDVYNAFQEFDRNYLIEQMHKKVLDNPTDIRWKRMRKIAYTLMEITPSIYMQGKYTLEKVCESKNGGGQGNALTPIFFANVIDPILKRLSEKYPELVIKAIHDDITVLGAPDVVFGDFYNDLNEWLTVNTKLQLQRVKTQAYFINGENANIPVWVKRPSITIAQNDEVNIYYGMQLCQIPVGDRNYIEEKLAAKGRDITRQIEKVTRVVAAVDKRLAIATLHYSSQNLADYFLRCSVPEFAETFEDNIDEVLRDMYALAMGINIFSDDGDNFTGLRAMTRIRKGGLGIRWLRMRPNYINAINLVYTQISRSGEGPKALWPKLAALVGNMEGPNRWEKLYETAGDDNRVVNSIKYSWNKLMDQRDTLIQTIQEYNMDWEMSQATIWRPIQHDCINFGQDEIKIGRSLNNSIQELLTTCLVEMVEVMDKDDHRATSYMATKESTIAQSLLTYRWTTNHITFTDTEVAEAYANYLGIVSPISKALYNKQILAMKQRRVDLYGHQLKCANGGSGGDQIRETHDEVNNFLASETKQLQGVLCTGGKNNTVTNRFKDAIGANDRALNDQDRGDRLKELQGMIPDMELNAQTAIPADISDLDYRVTLFDVKTLAAGQGYMDSAYKNKGLFAVNEREEKVAREYLNKARQLDRDFNNTARGEIGPVERRLLMYGDNGKVKGLVVGPYGECSAAVEQLVKFVATHQSRARTEGTNRNKAALTGMLASIMRSSLGLLIHRAWARVLITRAQRLVPREEAGGMRRDEEAREIAEIIHLEDRRFVQRSM
jgi:hypothetical protein